MVNLYDDLAVNLDAAVDGDEEEEVEVDDEAEDTEDDL